MNLWGCGYNRFFQLGSVGFDERPSGATAVLEPRAFPQHAGTDAGVLSVSGTFASTFCIDRNGTLWHWGGSENNSPPLSSPCSMVRVQCGDSAIACVGTDGAVYGWGDPDTFRAVCYRSPSCLLILRSLNRRSSPHTVYYHRLWKLVPWQ